MNFHSKPYTFVGQVNLKVQNLQRSLTFYQEVIGFQVLEQTERTANLTVDGKTSLLSIEQPDHVAPMQGKTTGLYHFALLLPARSDLARIVHHFAKLGLRFGSSDHLVSEALYLSDPDGNGIEIYRDRDPSGWKWHHGEVDMAVDPLNFQDLISSGTQQEWNGLPADTVMGHIHLHVSEMQKTGEFYVQGLGFEVVCRYGDQALFVSTGGYHHHIGLNTWNGVGAPRPPENSVGMQSFTLVLPNEAARNQVIINLKDLDAIVKEEKDIFVTIDPSGNQIQLLI